LLPRSGHDSAFNGPKDEAELPAGQTLQAPANIASSKTSFSGSKWGETHGAFARCGGRLVGVTDTGNIAKQWFEHTVPAIRLSHASDVLDGFFPKGLIRENFFQRVSERSRVIGWNHNA
jgi:hypothetical protein